MTTIDAPALPATAPTDLFTAADAAADAETFSSRVMAAALGGMETIAIHLGARLGWYGALREHGPLSPGELAAATDTQERYAREWLEHQAASGYLDVDGERFRLHAGAGEVLADPDSLVYLAPLGRMMAATGKAIDEIAAAYRDGGGVSWERLGSDARESQAALNRPMYLQALAQEIVPAVPELHERLLGAARVADVGTGEGWSAIGLAAGFGGVRVDGFDVDAASVEASRRHAAAYGVNDRVAFHHADVATLDVVAGYDVVTAFECVHDMPDPVGVLAAMRRMAAPGGYVLVMDERTADRFGPEAGPVERMLYGFSLTVCLPDGLSTPGSVGTGTVMRLDTLREYAQAAGFSDVEVLPVEHDMFRFHRLVL